jgi:hypothetical protein
MRLRIDGHQWAGGISKASSALGQQLGRAALSGRQSRGGEVSTVPSLPMLRRRFFAQYIKSAPNSPIHAN